MVGRSPQASKQTIISSKVAGNECRLLCCQSIVSEKPRAVGSHSHDYWQLELFRTGDVRVESEPLDYIAGAGEGLLIPPQRPHAFEYLKPGTEWVSFAFTPSRTPRATEARRFRSNAWNGVLRDALIELEPLSRLSDPEPTTVIQQLLDAFVALYEEERSERTDCDSPDLIDQIKQYVDQCRGGPVRVREVAHAVGLSTSYVSAYFRSREKQSLKQYIDRVRAEHAMRQLRYSELSISEIAAHMKFNDLFSFSRFLRRAAGIGPRAYRMQVQEIAPS